MARVTHSLGRDSNGMMIFLVDEGGIAFTLKRQSAHAMGAVSIMLTAEQIRDMNAVANPVPKAG